MDGLTTSVAVFGVLLSSAIAGVLVHARVPVEVISGKAAAMLRGSLGLVAVMAALMLVLMSVYLKTGFDTADRDVRRFSAELIDLDHTLRQAGPVAAPARVLLFRYAARTMKDVWPASNPTLRPDDTHSRKLLDQLEDAVGTLRTQDPAAWQAQVAAREQLHALVHARWSLDERSNTPLSSWLVAVLVFWLMLTFASIGLYLPRSKVMLTILGLCAVAMAGAVFLVVEYADPYEGIIVVSNEPMQTALFALTE